MSLLLGGKWNLAPAQALLRAAFLFLPPLFAFNQILAQAAFPASGPFEAASTTSPSASPADPAAYPAAPAPASPASPSAASFVKNDNRAIINGRPYERPSRKVQFDDYVRDTYGLPALARTSVRASFAQGIGHPAAWGQDWPGFGQRFGSAAAVTVMNGNARYAMETVFHEDMRYIPCHGCSIHRKIENAFMAEFTARHDSDGHRFFTLTPVISDMTGPVIANSLWVPGHSAVDGVAGSKLVFATRIGGHLFREFVWERRHYDPKLPD
jgi:hypothetical protein